MKKPKSPDLDKVLDELKKHRKLDTDADLARWLGVKQPNISYWRNNSTSATVLTILKRVEEATRAETKKNQRSTLIHAIVEFHPIFKTEGKDGWLPFATSRDGEQIPFLAGLKKRLEDTRSGIYVFYDSSGTPLYIGQVGRFGSKTNNLWNQMKLSFNRPGISRDQYGHSINLNEEFITVTDKGPKVSPSRSSRNLFEIACSFSAYQITPGMAGTIEALLLRVMGNMLLNNRMENLT